MDTVLTNVCLASIPGAHLPLLAEVRCLPGVQVTQGQDRIWVRWEAAEGRVLRALLPVPGVRLYVRREDGWYPAGAELPAFEVPERLEGRPLSGVLLPAPVAAVPPPDT